MTSLLCISVRFLQPYSHGRGEDDEPEWPPSPLRVVEALVAASAGRWNERRKLDFAVPALRWLEALPPPRIVAPSAKTADAPYRLYVPDNVADKVAAAWSRGREATIADYRAEKNVRPMCFEGDVVHFLYPLPKPSAEWSAHLRTLVLAARSITHLGWGIDMAVGDASVIREEQSSELSGCRWEPAFRGGVPLRTPKPGTLDDLMRKHSDFLNRLSDGGFRPVPPLRVFDIVHYRRQGEPMDRPSRVFELRNVDGSRFRYPHRRLIHLAGMVRHMAIDAMKNDPPQGVDDRWVETYIAGHAAEGAAEHRQLSYLPLQSIGHAHTDPGVRRVMIAAPIGDDAWLDHVARRLAGQRLVPLRGDEFGGGDPPVMIPVRHDNVARFYAEPRNTWASVTPVILPGHDDHKPAKTKRLIERALAQSGVDLPCEYEWSTFSRFPKSFSAHKYDRDGRAIGYIRPDHLRELTAVHLILRFRDGVQVPGPLSIGAGRHCGFGLMAAVMAAVDD